VSADVRIGHPLPGLPVIRLRSGVVRRHFPAQCREMPVVRQNSAQCRGGASKTAVHRLVYPIPIIRADGTSRHELLSRQIGNRADTPRCRVTGFERSAFWPPLHSGLEVARIGRDRLCGLETAAFLRIRRKVATLLQRCALNLQKSSVYGGKLQCDPCSSYLAACPRAEGWTPIRASS